MLTVYCSVWKSASQRQGRAATSPLGLARSTHCQLAAHACAQLRNCKHGQMTHIARGVQHAAASPTIVDFRRWFSVLAGYDVTSAQYCHTHVVEVLLITLCDRPAKRPWTARLHLQVAAPIFARNHAQARHLRLQKAVPSQSFECTTMRQACHNTHQACLLRVFELRNLKQSCNNCRAVLLQ